MPAPEQEEMMPGNAPSDPVRKLPVPYIALVKLSASRRLGKISHNEVNAILSVF